MIILLQADTTLLERIFDKYGWPTLILFILTIAIWRAGKWAAPHLKSYIEGLQKRGDEAHALLVEQLHLANMRATAESKEIVEALHNLTERANEIHGEQTSAIKATAQLQAAHTEVLKEIKVEVEQVIKNKKTEG